MDNSQKISNYLVTFKKSNIFYWTTINQQN